MEKQKKPNGHGGARPGAGRPKGSVDKVSINNILTAIDTTGGKSYVQALAEDFVHARENDRHLAQKYHNLILSKVAATLTQVEVTENEDLVEAKAAAFQEALAALAGSPANQGSK